METQTWSIAKCNSLIADFMGLELDEGVYVDNYRLIPNNDRGYNVHEKLKFHNTWNWIIPVVNEIVRQTDEPETLDGYTYITIHAGQVMVSTDLRGVYGEVVEIIENLNKQDNV